MALGPASHPTPALLSGSACCGTKAERPASVGGGKADSPCCLSLLRPPTLGASSLRLWAGRPRGSQTAALLANHELRGLVTAPCPQQQGLRTGGWQHPQGDLDCFPRARRLCPAVCPSPTCHPHPVLPSCHTSTHSTFHPVPISNCPACHPSPHHLGMVCGGHQVPK
jgi:hypothetical protein